MRLGNSGIKGFWDSGIEELGNYGIGEFRNLGIGGLRSRPANYRKQPARGGQARHKDGGRALPASGSSDTARCRTSSFSKHAMRALFIPGDIYAFGATELQHLYPRVTGTDDLSYPVGAGYES